MDWRKLYLGAARLRCRLEAFRLSIAGVAAIEFALILPVLLVIYVYMVEFSRAFDEMRKVGHLASTISDIVSQQSNGRAISDEVVSSLLGASATLTVPYNPQQLSATVSVVNLAVRSDKTCCDATVRWSYTQGGVLRPCGVVLQQVAETVSAAPNNILASAVGGAASGTDPGDIVITDVKDGFEPVFKGLFVLFSSGFQKTNYLPARSGGQLTLQSPLTAHAGQQGQVC